jgi:hypothetical protein
MKKQDAQRVWRCIENEGFDYCFRNYSAFKEVKDKKFHDLRKAYLKAAETFEKYLEKVRPDEYDNDDEV